jgi:hypothetical protein
VNPTFASGFAFPLSLKSYLCGVIKLLILAVVIYLGYRLFVGPPLLGGRQPKPRDKRDDDDGFADYEEIT